MSPRTRTILVTPFLIVGVWANGWYVGAKTSPYRTPLWADGENRGQAEDRLEREINDRLGKGPMLEYELHRRDTYWKRNDDHYETWHDGTRYIVRKAEVGEFAP